jgi:hypothetical protein
MRQSGRIGDGDARGVDRQSELAPEICLRMHQQACRHAELRQCAAEEGGVHLAAAEVGLEVDLDAAHFSQIKAPMLGPTSARRTRHGRNAREPEIGADRIARPLLLGAAW